jgi:hypothetical protein
MYVYDACQNMFEMLLQQIKDLYTSYTNEKYLICCTRMKPTEGK